MSQNNNGGKKNEKLLIDLEDDDDDFEFPSDGEIETFEDQRIMEEIVQMKESQSSEPISADESRESPDDEEVSTVESGSSSSSSGLSLLSCGEMVSNPAEVRACC